MIPDTLKNELRANGTITINLKVVAKSSRDEVVGFMPDGALKVKITAAPEKGKANAAICEFLAAEFGVPKRNVEIVRGETSAQKQVRITS